MDSVNSAPCLQLTEENGCCMGRNEIKLCTFKLLMVDCRPIFIM